MAIAASLAVASAAALAGSSPALAAKECESCRPWWHLTSGARPTVLQPEGKGTIVLTVANLGDTDANGETSPVTITDTLPAGLTATAIRGVAGRLGADGAVECKKATLTCAFSGKLPPFDMIEVLISVNVGAEASSSEENRASVSGGDAPDAQVSRELSIGEGPTPFGVEDYELRNEEAGGAPAASAGSHPFQQTTTFTLNQTGEAKPAGLAKDISFKWPPGLVGDPTVLPTCSLGQFLAFTGLNPTNECPAQTAVGVALITINEPVLNSQGVYTFTVPLFNLEAGFGEPARFGFLVPGTPVLIDPAVRSGDGEDYGLTVSSFNTSQTAAFLSATVTVWGTPGDPRHDASRGNACLRVPGSEGSPCTPLEQVHPPAFLTLPTSCSGASLQTEGLINSWADLTRRPFPVSQEMGMLDGCNQLQFSPTISAQPSTDRASAPSGLDFNLDFHDEGLTSGTGRAQSQLKDTVVTLPEGFTINPSAGVGLAGCTPADYARETLASAPGAGCPNESKLGTVEVETPLLTQTIHGSLFIAQPYENPFPEPQAGHPNGTLVALYVVLKNPETGVLIKLAGKVTPNPVTGQLTTTFANNPQLPFDHFNFHFREGQQAPLISPPVCGTYTTQAQLTPWSAPLTSLTESSSFTITKGYDGGACPSGGVPPFHPEIASGTLNNNAGAFSPFYLHLTRTDGEQEISGFSTNMPAGLTGDLTGVPFCPEANIEAARHKTGAQEEASPSCPAASRIGHTLVGTGVGAVLAYVPGKVYLAGPFHGAPFSLVSVTSATVGPFDLGTVVLRFGLNIDPSTAQVSVTPTSSEPIPTIIDGIVTHVRDIRVYIDRSNFILNPTSCNPMAISSTLNSDLGHSATVSSPFQAANCANLAFKPSFKASTSGKTSRTQGASLHVSLTYPKGALGKDANIKSVKVDLPKQLPSRLPTLQKACIDTTFEANPAACPAESRVGTAKAVTPILPVPLEGPAYFVSHGGAKFPELIIVLQGYGITIDLHGETFISKAGITSSTFRTVPDQPVTSFELTLPEGPYSALAAPGGLCHVTKTKIVKKKVTRNIKGHKRKVTRKLKKRVAASLVMPTMFVAQNGMVVKHNTPISVTGCPKAKTKKKAKGRHGKKKK